MGDQGGTRKKIERSSGAIVQYVGQVRGEVNACRDARAVVKGPKLGHEPCVGCDSCA